MQKVCSIQCLVFLILQNVLCGLSVWVVNNTVTDVSSLNSTPRKESGILRDILNQESVVRFSMVQKMQEFTMDVIEMKKNNDVLMRKLEVLTEEQITSKEKMSKLRKENENMKYQIRTLQNDVNIMNVTLEKVSIICGTYGKEINELRRICENQHKNVTDVRENMAEKQEVDQQRAALKMMEGELKNLSLTANSTIQGFVRDINGSIHEKVATNSKNILEQRSELDAIHSDLSIVLRQLKNRDGYKVKSNFLDQNGTNIGKGDPSLESLKETGNIRDVSAIKDGVRLVNGESWMEGRVEIYEDGDWGTICDENWDTRDASVVCKTIGFSYGTPVVYRRGVKPIVMGNVSCDGSELNIRSCPHSSAQKCKSRNVAGVACTN
ncbi:macrophage scavenger receptor types I and II-like, partial [Saccostrea cucullata]|uniref:macrophage scavenger receptor types I and II-like n=1 Tax=Saccostrea cuccullata TaxID=36930 RepID=UPI002ECFC79E